MIAACPRSPALWYPSGRERLAVAAHLPIAARVEAVRLIARGGPAEPWRAVRELPLGG
jgi:hypothetical protein